MGLFHRKSTWEKLTEPVARVAPKAVKSGLTAVGGLVGVTLLSAAVSAARRRKESE